MKGLKLLIILLFISTGNAVQAQYQKFYYFSVGAQVGTSHYQGDLDDHGMEPWRDGGSTSFRQKLWRPSLGIQVNYHFNPYMFLRLGINQGWIRGSDSTNVDPARRWRNLHFRSPVTEFTLQLVVELNSKNDFYRYRTRWSPYIFFGLGVFKFNPQAQADPDWRRRYPRLFPYSDGYYDLQPMGTEGQNLPEDLRTQFGIRGPYSLWSVCIPLGFGLRFRLNRYWDLRADASLRVTFTDYLDDVSGKYANPDLILRYSYNERAFLFADRSGYANFGVGRSRRFDIKDETYRNHYGAYQYDGEIRGNSEDRDMYGFIQIGITRILK